jgi:DNA repair protein SbcD/Mre11
MRLMHTGDWHLGKVLKGVARIDEQATVMAELVEVAERDHVDVVLVAGDVFESAVPSPEAQRLAWTTLLALRSTGAEVVVIAGNHDNGESFDAVRPVFAAAGITVLGRVSRPADGGLLELDIHGEHLRVAMLPFVSQRGVVRAAQLLELDAAQMDQEYASRLVRLIGSLTASFATDAVNVLLAHAFVRGGRLGGGERDAQTIHDYGMSATGFPPAASYVALGHLHRAQRLPAPCPTWYSGSPIAVDFGEEEDVKGVLLVDVAPGRPAAVEERPLAGVRRLRTVHGSLSELTDRAADLADGWLRVIVTEPARSGLADDVRAALPNALEVRLVGASPVETLPAQAHAAGRGPQELVREYLTLNGVHDDRIGALFDQLLDDELQP